MRKRIKDAELSMEPRVEFCAVESPRALCSFAVTADKPLAVRGDYNGAIARLIPRPGVTADQLDAAERELRRHGVVAIKRLPAPHEVNATQVEQRAEGGLATVEEVLDAQCDAIAEQLPDAEAQALKDYVANLYAVCSREAS